ncbi:MAG: ferrous iron transport protein A [Alphaproteobacteria bacterium]|nr:MAG: ferrous iron transport protein A [Alphaproteobacteria bacterium]PZO32656.1 MAG: ferrous iron transport protein A [Alphaproteobacteria bacterium]
MSNIIQLSEARIGDRGTITRVGGCIDDEHNAELERRLLELGFVEGARVHLIHEGIIRRDPIALRVDDMTVALRRREAASLTIELDSRFAEAAE